MKFNLFAKPRRFGDEVIKLQIGNFTLAKCTWNHAGKAFEIRKVNHPNVKQIYITLFGKLYKLNLQS